MHLCVEVYLELADLECKAVLSPSFLIGVFFVTHTVGLVTESSCFTLYTTWGCVLLCLHRSSQLMVSASMRLVPPKTLSHSHEIT